ncbi:MAG TPA: type II CAAX endopeptidase family protein [Haliscomenobacter sp.]|uniref:CPBP family intramembrane glutamic endopeptidase n=1 Tax=Haliscomenobacter sp. TaxID=2717303 RepID=UPI002C76EC34|nr:type II CAAX endopeptidase family protein [Haliscomenobacter sp.]HOY16838.1 type II CAAX endopeptidase family protein [Haliscomenobacter sp.]
MKFKALSIFFLLAYAISWLLWSPLWLPFFNVKTEAFLPYQHGFGGLGPLLAAFLTTAIFDGKPGLHLLWKRLFQWKPLTWTAIAIFLPFVFALPGGLMARFSDGAYPDFSKMGTSGEFPELNILGFLLYNIVFFGYGEEVGWRGFVLPRLQEKYSALAATLLLSVFWAGWHLPLFAYRPGYASMNVAGVIGWFFSIVAGAVLFTWLFNGSRGSLLACALFHGLTDVVFLCDYGNDQMMQHIGMLVTIWGVAVLLIWGWRNLAPGERETTTTFDIEKG